MINYSIFASNDAYKQATVNLIAKFEGHISQATDIGDGKATIGYGYTFERSNNVSLWEASGVQLTSAQWDVLESIDSAGSNSTKKQLALDNFNKTLSNTEAKNLLKKTMTSYESVANSLGMPDSEEKMALVSITYNRGVTAVNDKMGVFKSDIIDGERPEAWYEIRYNAQTTNQTFKPGIANRRYAESDSFDLYDNSAIVLKAEAEKVATMYTHHRDFILNYENTYSPLTAAGLYGNGIQDIYHELHPAIAALKSAYQLSGSYEEVQKAYDVHPIVLGDGTSYDSDKNDQDLLIGDDNSNTLEGRQGDDALAGNGGDDDLEGGEGNDSLLGGNGQDHYIFNDDFGEDVINEGGDLGDGSGRIIINSDTLSGSFEMEDDMPNQMWWIGTETDNKGSVFLNGGTLYVYKEDAEGVITIENFKNDGGFGFTLGGLPAKDPGHPDVPAPPSGNEPHFDPKADDINKHFKHPPALIANDNKQPKGETLLLNAA